MSEIKQINTGVAELLAVKVPDGATPIRVERGNMLIVNQDHRPEYDDYIWLPPGNWTPLGIDIELTEEQCREVMPNYGGKLFDYDPNVYNSYPDYKFKDHPFESKFFDTAKEAFASLMQANGINDLHLILKRLS